jgi:hypothetical protein
VIVCASDVGPDQAFALIRAFARGHNTRIADLAGAIVADPGPSSRPHPALTAVPDRRVAQPCGGLRWP